MALPAAAVLHNGNGEGDILLNDILVQCQQQGWQLKGLATEQGKDFASKKPMSLRDIHSGEVFVISQYLGRDSRGCSLDLGGLSAAGEVLRKIVVEGQAANSPDLVFINRFGHGESQGRGLSEEFAALIGAGIPMLTLVSKKYLDSWLTFSDGMAETLPLERYAIEQWLSSVAPKALAEQG